MDNFQENLAKLQPEVKDYFSSYKGIELNLLICQRNNLTGEAVGLNTDLIVKLFFKEIEFSNLILNIKEIFKFDEAKAKKLATDIIGIRFLVVDKFFGGQASDFLKKIGASAGDYQKINEEQIVAVKKEKDEDNADIAKEKAEKEKLLKEEVVTAPIEASMEDVKFKPDWVKEKAEVVDVFKNDLAGILLFTKPEEDFNDVLVYLLLENGEELSSVLERNLFGNNEKLTEEQFSFEGRLTQPTISNWLNYFIKEKGTGKFDNIVLTDFLVKSDNVKKLSEEEKGAVKKLLLLYRNLKFFPDSMPNQTGEGWEIIPSTGEVSESTKARTVSVPQTDDFSAKAKAAATSGVISEEDKKKIDELKQILSRYQPESLERKAVEEEIKKLEVRSQK